MGGQRGVGGGSGAQADEHAPEGRKEEGAGEQEEEGREYDDEEVEMFHDPETEALDMDMDASCLSYGVVNCRLKAIHRHVLTAGHP